MPKQVTNQLDALKVKNAGPGLHCDGLGLYLEVGDTGLKHWTFRYQMDGKRRMKRIAAVGDMTLKNARAEAARLRAMVAEGTDPLASKSKPAAIGEQAVGEQSTAPTFASVAADYLTAHAPQWKTGKQAQVWLNSLTTHAASIWNKPVDTITRDDVLNLLLPIWHAKPETGNRVRGRIHDVLQAAIARGLRPGPSPAAWVDGLEALLPSWKAVRTVEHHAALDWRKAPQFYRRLRSELSVSRLALELVMLTACRVAEAAGAEWAEIDLQAMVWTIPAARAKSDRPHRVPLVPRALEILAVLPRSETPSQQRFVFPGSHHGHLNPESVRRCLQRDLGEPELTVHGMRSTFREWAAASGYPFDLAEQQLAHLVGDETVRAYYRGDALERRTPMMEQWAAYLAGEARP